MGAGQGSSPVPFWVAFPILSKLNFIFPFSYEELYDHILHRSTCGNALVSWLAASAVPFSLLRAWSFYNLPLR